MGEVAILPNGDHFIYYLVTTEHHRHKPTNKNFFKTLCALRDELIRRNTVHLFIPKIGCGKDDLSWPYVSEMLNFVFRESPFPVSVCYLK